MSHGYAAAHAYVVQTAFVRQSCGDRFELLETLLGSFGNTEGWRALAEFAAYGDDSSLAECFYKQYLEAHGTAEGFDDHQRDREIASVDEAYRGLQEAFSRATEVEGRGLSLFLICHARDSEGGRYDDVDGVFFAVAQTHQYTLAGYKYREFFDLKQWTTFI